MVVANAVAALAEIAEASGKDVLQVTRESIKKLLRALNECTEWGQARPSASNCAALVTQTRYRFAPAKCAVPAVCAADGCL